MSTWAIAFAKPHKGVLVAGIEAESAEDAMFTYLRWMDGEECPVKTAGEPEAMVIAGPFKGRMLRAVPC